MIRALVDFALKNRWLVLGGVVVLTAWGIVSFRNLPVEAYPDVANNYVQIITQWPGRSAEEIERQVTVPVEIQMAGIPHLTHLRSTTLAGLSSLMLIFDDDSTSDINREHVLERLSMVNLPANLVPQMGTDWSPVGQIYWYTLESTNPAYDVMEKKSLEDWTLEKSFKGVAGVVDVSSFGGPTKEYQIKLDPEKLVSYGLSIAQVEQQIANNNTNGGGSFIEQGAQQINVQSVGLFTSVQDIENTVVKTQNGAAIKIKDIATVAQGPKIRLGQIGKSRKPYAIVDGKRIYDDAKVIDNPDTVEGIVLLQKGDDSDPVLEGIHSEVEKLNGDKGHPGILPKGVKIVPFLDRSDLVKYTVETVEHNLTAGMLLVSIILFLFLGNVRGAIIVALTIPFALLFASICLDLSHIPANLLSLGALDFGMVVDGSVVMIENMVRHLSQHDGTRTPAQRFAKQRMRCCARSSSLAASSSPLICPSSRCRPSRAGSSSPWPGPSPSPCWARWSSPSPWRRSWPASSSARAPRSGRTPSWSGSPRTIAARSAPPLSTATLPWASPAVLFAFAIFLAFGGPIGSEFLPHLDEGSIWVRGTLPPSEGPTASIDFTNKARLVMASFPEVTQVVSQTGRPDDGTDTAGFFNTEYFVDLKRKEQWRPVFHQNKEELIAAIDKELSKFPGVIWNYSQPISDNMEEAVSGVKGELAVKLYGDDLRTLEKKAEEIQAQMATVKGIEDLGIFRIVGQPNLNYTVDRDAAARWGINVADIQDAMQTAVGANALTQVQQGEARYDVTLRYQQQYRDTREAIENVRLLAPSGERVSLAQLTKASTDDGAEQINREARPALHRHQVLRARPRPGLNRRGGHRQGKRERGAARRLPPGMGRRIRKPEARRQAHGYCRSHHRSGHLPHPLHHVPLLQVGHADSGLRGHGLHRRTAGAFHHRHQLLGLFRGRFSGALRRLGGDRRHHDRVHQPVACAPQRHGSLYPGTHRRSRRRRLRASAASGHDDHAGGHAGPAARRALARHRLRLAAPLRHRHRRRSAGQPGHRRLPAAHALRVDGPRRRRIAGCGIHRGVLSHRNPLNSDQPGGAQIIWPTKAECRQ